MGNLNTQNENSFISKAIKKHVGRGNKSNTEEFITKATSVHGDKYGYDKTKYADSRTKVEIYCNKCKEYFWQYPLHYLQGIGCQRCKGLNQSIKQTSNTETFIAKSINTHGNKFKYDKANYVNSKTKVEIFHPKCGKYFAQKPNDHLNGVGCPFCKQSKLEFATEKYLTDKHIRYEAQKRFNGCKDKRPLPFDFHLPEHNALIECQGKQHYRPLSGWFGHSFTKEQAFSNLGNQCTKDTIKRKYAKKRGLKLIEINYRDMNRIADILDRAISGVPEHEQLELAI